MEVLEDNKLFKKLGFIENLDLSLNCSAKDFQKCFENNVSSWQVFVGVNGPNKKFQGKIGGNAFKLYKTISSIFESNLAGASGTFVENGGKLKVNVWIYFPIEALLIGCASILLSGVCIWVIIIQINTWVFPSLLSVFVALSVMLLYLAIRSKVKKLTSEIERELNYWLTKL
jgi:hypothetical protein